MSGHEKALISKIKRENGIAVRDLLAWASARGCHEGDTRDYLRLATKAGRVREVATTGGNYLYAN